MAAGILPAPGTKAGPCRTTACGHRDCAATRVDAASPCRFCGKDIGYGKPFYRARLSGALGHGLCVDEAFKRNDARLGEF